MRLDESYPMSLLLTLLFLMVASVSDAATWRVARDGSGDFSIIQDAVDAAAPGDTITIGPGRYEETTLFQSDVSNTELTHIAIAKDGLTIIGDSRDTVVIGPQQYVARSWGMAMLWDGAENLRAANLTFVNVSNGLRAFGSFEVENVRFVDCHYGILGYHRASGRVITCEFEGCDDGVMHGPDLGLMLVVRGSSFRDCGYGVYQGNYSSVEISDCSFRDGTVGYRSGGDTAVVRGCTFEGHQNYGVVAGYGDLTLENNDIHAEGIPLYLASEAGARVVDNTIHGGQFATIRIGGWWNSIVSNNQIIRGAGYAVKVIESFDERPIQMVDLRHNDWGSTDLEEIAGWIWDANDDPDIRAIVEVAPVLDASVPTQELSIGALKARY